MHSKFKSHWLHFHLLEYTTYFQLPFSHTLIKYFDHFSVLFSGCKILSPVERTRDIVERDASENNFSPGENRSESVGIRNSSQLGDSQTRSDLSQPITLGVSPFPPFSPTTQTY